MSQKSAKKRRREQREREQLESAGFHGAAEDLPVNDLEELLKAGNIDT